MAFSVYCPEQLASLSVYDAHDPEIVRRREEEENQYRQRFHREIFVNRTNLLLQPYLFKIFASKDGQIAQYRVQVSPRSLTEVPDFGKYSFSGTLRITNVFGGLVVECAINSERTKALSLKATEHVPAFTYLFTVGEKFVESSSFIITVSPAPLIRKQAPTVSDYHFQISIFTDKE